MRLRMRVTGRVQGVGFRWWVSRQARELGLAGTVRNAPDGTVEVEAEGAAGVLEELRRRLRDGPPAAVVSGIVDEEASTAALPQPFRIIV